MHQTVRATVLINQFRDKQYIIEELFKKTIKALVTAPLPTVINLINAQKYHTKYTEKPMIPSSNVNVNECKFR